MEKPELIVANFPEDHFDGPVVGAVVRVDAHSPETITIGFIPDGLSTPRIIDSLILVRLDRTHNFIPRVLVPYQPPQLYYAKNGQLLNQDGSEVAREWQAILRTERVEIRQEYSDYIGKLNACFSGNGPGCSPMAPSDPNYHPDIDAYYAPEPPNGLFASKPR